METAGPVSAVIVSYNCWPLLDACLETVLRDPSIGQVLVVDNASSDEAPSLIRRHYPNVDVVALDFNSGFSYACNVGLARATQEIVLFLNPDTEFHAEAPIGVLVDVLRSESGVGLVGPKLVQVSGELDHACIRGEPTPGRAVSYLLGLHRLFPTSRFFAGYVGGHLAKHLAQDVEVINGAFMMARRSDLERLDGFDERFWMYMEDIDLCRRFRELGMRVRYEPSVSVTHVKGGTDGGVRSPRAQAAFFDSMAIYNKKWYRNPCRHPVARGLGAVAAVYGWWWARRS